jgi:hypothetical protein
MTCQVPRFRPLPLAVTFPLQFEAAVPLLRELWTNTAQLVNDTKAAEDELTVAIETLDVATGTGFANVGLRLDTVENTADGNFLSIGALETSVTGNTNNIASANLVLSSQDTRITSVEGDIGTLTTASTALDARVTTAEGTIAATSLTLNSLATQVTSIDGTVNTLTSSLASLDSRVVTADGTANSALTLANTANTTANSAQSASTTNASSLAALTTRVTTAEGTISSTSLSLTSLATRVTTAEGNISSTSSSLASLTTTVSGVSTTANSGLSLATTANNTANTANGKANTNTSSIATLTTNLSTTTSTANSGLSLATTANNTANTANGKANTNTTAISNLTSTVNTVSGTATSALNLVTTAGTEIDSLQAQATLVASTTSGGFTRIAGMKATATASTTNLAFVGDKMQWLDNGGNVGLTYNGTFSRFQFNSLVFIESGFGYDTGGNSFFNSSISGETSNISGTHWRDLNGLGFWARYVQATGKFRVDGGGGIELNSAFGSIAISSDTIITNSSSTKATLDVNQANSYYIAVFRQFGTQRSYISATGAYVNSSTLRKKEVIDRITDTTADICSMITPGMLRYKSNQDDNPELEIGLAAEEVVPFFPEVCFYNPATGMLDGIDYARLVAPLMVAIKQLNDRLTTLENN